MHCPTRLRRVGPRLARLRRAKRGVFGLTRYYALFPTPQFYKLDTCLPNQVDFGVGRTIWIF